MPECLLEPADLQPCRWPAVAPADAALSRRLGRGLRLDLTGGAMQWLLLPPAAGVGAHDAAGDWLALDTGADPLLLQDGARFLLGLTGIDGADYEDAWPPWLTGAVAGRLADTPLAGLRAIRRASAPAPGRASLVLPWRLQEPGHSVAVLAAAAVPTWDALLSCPHLAPLRMPWEHWLPLALDWPLALASHRLPLALFDTLAVGDVIVPDHACFDCGGQGRVTLGRRRWRAAFGAPGRLELLTEENLLQTDPLDDTVPALAVVGHELTDETSHEVGNEAGPEAGHDGSAAPLPGMLEVTLRFELGRLRLTLDQLRALGPHSVLEVLDGAPQAIAILCGGAEVGRGEAVEVDGRVGVRITRWSGAC